MFDLSFSELLVIALCAVLFIRPDDLPVVLRACGKAFRWLRGLAQEVRGGVDKVLDESGLTEATGEVNRGMGYLRGDDGKLYPAYDVSELEALRSPKPEAEREAEPPKPESPV